MVQEQTKEKRLTLDLKLAFHRRLKARAALEGVSMRQYCLTAIEKQIIEDEAEREDGSATRSSRK